MSPDKFVSTLADRLSDYLAFRRLGGLESTHHAQMLRYFDRFLHQHRFQGSRPTRPVIEHYLASIQHLEPGTRANRLSAVRQVCRYLQQFDPPCFVPEPAMVRLVRPVRVPHIYSRTEIEAIVQAAWQLPPPGSLRAHTYATLFGLLYATGLRCGEAFALNLDDVDLHGSACSSPGASSANRAGYPLPCRRPRRYDATATLGCAWYRPSQMGPSL